MTRMFRAFAGQICSTDGKIALDAALTYAKTSASKYRRACRDGEIEAMNFYRCAKRDLDAAIVEAVEFGWRVKR